MGNLADIPDRLLSVDSRTEFVNWLVEFPVDTSVRIELAIIWGKFTGTRLTPDQFQQIQD